MLTIIFEHDNINNQNDYINGLIGVIEKDRRILNYKNTGKQIVLKVE